MTSAAIHLATECHLLLFDKLLLLTKNKEDHFVYQHHFNVCMCSVRSVCTYVLYTDHLCKNYIPYSTKV